MLVQRKHVCHGSASFDQAFKRGVLTLNVLFTLETTQFSWPLSQIAALVVAPRQPGPDRARFYWKRCINDLLLFAETRFCDSSQMKSMADFGPTREGDQLRARDPRRKKIILESKSTKSSLSTSDIAVEAGCTSGYVCRVLKAKANEEQPSCPAQATETGAPHEAPEKYENWFQSVIETHFPDLKAALCTCVRETPEQKSQKY